MANHFLIFNYDGEHTLTVTVFDETMCHRHYMSAALANAASSSSDEWPRATISFLSRACI
jgi:hypothetical protein